jgi:DNA-binding CsgD family transcriptional regulator
LVAEGRGTKEIASILHVTVKTVEFHKAGIKRQLDLRSTAELTKYALTEGLIGM